MPKSRVVYIPAFSRNEMKAEVVAVQPHTFPQHKMAPV